MAAAKSTFLKSALCGLLLHFAPKYWPFLFTLIATGVVVAVFVHFCCLFFLRHLTGVLVSTIKCSHPFQCHMTPLGRVLSPRCLIRSFAQFMPLASNVCPRLCENGFEARLCKKRGKRVRTARYSKIAPVFTRLVLMVHVQMLQVSFLKQYCIIIHVVFSVPQHERLCRHLKQRLNTNSKYLHTRRTDRKYSAILVGCDVSVMQRRPLCFTAIATASKNSSGLVTTVRATEIARLCRKHKQAFILQG